MTEPRPQDDRVFRSSWRWLFAAVLFLPAFTGSAAVGEGTLSEPPPPTEEGASTAPSTDPDEGSAAGTKSGVPADKAPAKTKPSAVPEFTLPEVVITGENQLTIGAKRLEIRTEDVTAGTRDLMGLHRPVNDLPGLEKSLTGSSAAPGRDAKDVAFILHAGGGSPSCAGGWALFGQEMKKARFLLSGEYSRGRGSDAGPGRQNEQRKGYGLEVWAQPSPSLDLNFSRTYTHRIEDLPYTSSREDRRGVGFTGQGEWRFAENLRTRIRCDTDDMPFDFPGAPPLPAVSHLRVREPRGSVQLSADSRHPLLEGVDLSAGYQRSMGDFPAGAVEEYRMGWTRFQLRLKAGEHVRGTAGMGVARFSRFGLPARLDLYGEVFILLDPKTRVVLAGRRERVPQRYFSLFSDRPYSGPADGFAPPLDMEHDLRAEISRKFQERWVLTCAGSLGRWKDPLQWADAGEGTDPFVPSYFSVPRTIGQLDYRRVDSSLECELGRHWSVTASHVFRSGKTHGERLTDWPAHEGSLKLARKAGSLDWNAILCGASRRNAFGTQEGVLGSYWIGGASARYAVQEHWTLWAEGMNLLGRRYEPVPGYPAVRYHLTAGIEAVF